MILKDLNKEIEDFKTKQITIVQGLNFNQFETLNKIFFYYNSKYVTGEVDDDGDRKYFYNIVKNPCKVFSKAIDFDTKNIRLLTVGGGDPIKTWFMERDLKYWMRDIQFGRTLNRIFRELPIFGSVVLKNVDGVPYFVDLRNFVVEQSADRLESSSYIVEIHNITPDKFRKVGKQMGWKQEDIDKTIEEFHKMKDTSHIRLFERYGEVEELVGDKKTYTYKRVFFADVGVDEYDNKGNLTLAKQGVELSSEEWEGHPYWEFHAEKMSGRWLGIGVVETLFEPQIRQNEIANLQSKSSYWAALRLFFSKDSNMAGNLMNDKSNGDVITGDSEVTQIDMSDRNLAFFNEETRKWLQNRDELTFSYDVVQGERLPAGTPLGSAQIAITQTLSYFEQIQENIALDVKEMLYEVIIPRFIKESSTEHTLRLVGKDLDVYIEMVKNEMILKEVIRQTLQGKIPNNHDRDIIGLAIEESIKQGKEKNLTIPRNHYDKVKYDIDIDITGESVDTRVRYATKFAILQAMTADPTVITDPVKRNFLMSMAEDGGVNPIDFFGVQSKKIEDLVPMQLQMGGKMGGGGVSAPVMNNKIPGQMATTL